METITEAPAKPADEADIRYVAVDLPVVLDQPWYTTSELMKIFGITAPGAFSQFWRTVEHKSTKEGKAYRTGKALLERIEQTRGIDAQAKLASEYAAVEGRAPQKTKPGKIKAKVVDAPAPKKPDPTPAKVIDPTAQTASTAPKPAETSVAEDRVSANGHVSAPSLTGGINKIYGLKPRPMIGDEETLSKIEAYAGLLHSLLFDADDVDMAMVFLAGDVAHLAEGLLGRMRPAIDAITEPA